MSYQPSTTSLPAPCLVDVGIVVNPKDMVRILQHLGRVRYIHQQEEQVLREGEGYVVEVFSDPQQATLVANRSLYLNVASFDYLEMGQLADNQPYFDLIQDNRCLRILPQSNPLTEQNSCNINDATLEAMLAEALTARWDACLDDDSNNFTS
ncbi:hypothetical protein SPB21_25555 [Leptothoe sp. ISB3NOV94-8A]|uniref:Uncharacterized protein n=1 Tax=Adonisia turfae CCMR0081 TaxID=2292702 RepID=A0A6M0RQ25_9CYAN|nr:hypothetical protein [Adonisia turfae]MDV3347693.1 hypothetical protein [Leptothoe sp. LEGE 181152]NEZ57893.1 hypothetical protein [Adonisia turfae CCMR0081]